MADASSDRFLSGMGIPVALPEVETELTRLWGPAAEREGGPELEQPTVTRVSLANLVVAQLDSAKTHSDEILDTVVTRYPCRAIVLRTKDGIGRRVLAEVTAVCQLPAPGLPQVCSERIVLSTGPDATDLLPGAVLPLLESGLPVCLWWMGDPNFAAAAFRGLSSESARVLIDLPDPAPDAASTLSALDASWHHYAREVAWFGIARWRELVAQFFDAPGTEANLRRLSRMTIDIRTPTAAEPARVAVWLAAWLAGQLGWTPLSRELNAAGELTLGFANQSKEASVIIRPNVDSQLPAARIQGVTLSIRDGDHADDFRAVRLVEDGPDVVVEVCSESRCVLPSVVHSPEVEQSARIASWLESNREDVPYRNALPIARWVLGGAS